MATTRIISLHGRKEQSVAQTLRDRINYAENPEKTDGGMLVSSYECLPESAADEFTISKYIYKASTSTVKEQAAEKDILAYMIRQSFKPGEITPEDADRLRPCHGVYKGKAPIYCHKHTDKAHIHNHVIFNSTTLDCDRKFSEPHQSGREVARISDRLCRERRLSVVEHPRQKGMAYKEWGCPAQRTKLERRTAGNH